jgi:hypothetical protein
MSHSFRIGVDTADKMLSNPPPQFRHLNLLFAPFGVSVGDLHFPASFWTDFAGMALFKWYWAVWKLAEGENRYARLPFWYTYEMWLRRTTKQWWRLSLVEYEPDRRKITHEVLLIPETVESALLTAIQKLITGARHAGVWTEDCAALEALLNDGGNYLAGLEAGTIRPPTFLTNGFAIPIARPRPPQPAVRPPVGNPRLPPGMASPHQPRVPPQPLRCPRCTAILQPWPHDPRHLTCPCCALYVSR